MTGTALKRTKFPNKEPNMLRKKKSVPVRLYDKHSGGPQIGGRRNPPIPMNKDNTVNWKKLLPEILTSRPEGMTLDVYHQKLKQQARAIKVARR